jgi:uncharacterized tellurite resistance protein B-like protein
MKNNTRKNKQWLRNRDQLKHPKVFNVKMLRLADGSFHILGGETKAMIKRNQHRIDEVSVDTRDFTRELRRSKISSL